MRMILRTVIYRYYWVERHHYLSIQLQLLQQLLLPVVEQQLTEHNMPDNTKHLHPEFAFVVVVDENQLEELLIEVEFVVLFEPKIYQNEIDRD